DFSPVILEELLLLKQDLQRNAPILMLNLFPTPPPDYIDWASQQVDRGGMRQEGKALTWLDTDWFFAETMLFRLIVELSRYPETGRDPYTPIKEAELLRDDMWVLLEEALDIPGGAYDRLPKLLHFATWGNRMDLSYAAAAERGTNASTDDLLVDDAERVLDHLIRSSLTYFPEAERGVGHVILDNAGTELAMDLVLADTLLTGFCDVVILHTKAFPTFVSDATNTDVRDLIQRFIRGPHGGLKPSSAINKLGERLQLAFDEGRLRLAANLFWNSASFIWDMPRQLRRVFEDSNIVVLKGDANYRRFVGDALWDPTTNVVDVMGAFPSPLVALRTLKSDPVVGLIGKQIRGLDATDNHWRHNGQRGLVQMVLQQKGDTQPLTTWR
ncbi:MAG: damage-control phosphatase ARMT1 family protein, partial [Chloroflexota bacterium]